MKAIAERLKPGQELFQALEDLIARHSIDAGVIVSLVGSVTEAMLRFAGQDEATLIAGPLEIVSATGTIARSGSHIHLAGANKQGTTFGGHLMPGSRVYTTVELVALDLSASHIFSREFCPLSGYDELVVTVRSQPQE
jgi:uncharacterized protein